MLALQLAFGMHPQPHQEPRCTNGFASKDSGRQTGCSMLCWGSLARARQDDARFRGDFPRKVPRKAKEAARDFRGTARDFRGFLVGGLSEGTGKN